VQKNPDDFHTRFKDHWHEVVEALVLSGRNSPSVIMWSIGNEIPGRTSREGVEWSWKLANAVHRLDPTRPVTAAIHGTLGPTLVPAPATARPGRGSKLDNASTVFLDVPGYNYRLEDIEREQREHPERVVYASETFPKDVVDYRRMMDRDPYFLGEFLWTALDYIGEAGIGMSMPIKKGERPIGFGAWPYTIANCGDLDLTGAQKPPSLARDVAWGLSPLEVLVHRSLVEGMTEFVSNWGWPDELPSWTWPGLEGRRLAVRVFTAGDRVEVLLNGASVGSKPVRFEDKMRAELEVPYAPGELEVVAYRGNRVIGRKRLRTAGPATRLRIVPERMQLDADRQGLAYVRLLVTDATGAVLPEDVRDVRLSVSGPGRLVAFGNGNPQWTGSLQSPATQTFRGQALAILRGTGKPGLVGIQAQAKGLASASVTLRAINEETRT
jgi:beta-galactosidase